MPRHALTATLCSTLLAAGAFAAPPATATPVQVTLTTDTHPVLTAEFAPDSLYPVRPGKDVTDPINAKIDARRKTLEKESSAVKAAALLDADPEIVLLRAQLKAATDSLRKTINISYPLVTLNNGRLEVKIVPTLGMRVLNAIDLKTGQSLSGTADPRQWEKEPYKDILAFDAGYVEFSYPYFEHGTGVRQPAGFRVINHPDGSVTVAMNARFTQFQEPRHMGRYGRFSQLQFSQWVTLKPGEAAYTVTYRLDNPTPLRRSARFWVDQLLQADKYDENCIIYPAGYIMPHGGQSVTPFLAPGGRPMFNNVSWFALHTDYGFAGVYRPATDTNSLVIKDPKLCPGLKLYTPGGAGGRMEIWIGSNSVFEDPAPFADPYVPTQFTATYRNVTGFGRVVWANEEFALTRKDKKLYLVPTHKRDVELQTMTIVNPGSTNGWSGQGGTASPDEPLPLGEWDDHFVTHVQIMDGNKVAANFDYPLTYTDTTKQLDDVKTLGGKFRLELEETSNHVGAPRAYDALKPAAQLANQTKVADDPEQALSWANVSWRYGDLDTAEKLSDCFKGDPNADYLHALVAWERAKSGKDVDFGKAGVQANYLRALQAIANKNTPAALALLDELIKVRPTAYRPRLAAAFLRKDLPAAQTLAAENPASPEAQALLELLGDKEGGGQSSQGIPPPRQPRRRRRRHRLHQRNHHRPMDPTQTLHPHAPQNHPLNSHGIITS